MKSLITLLFLAVALLPMSAIAQNSQSTVEVPRPIRSAAPNTSHVSGFSVSGQQPGGSWRLQNNRALNAAIKSYKAAEDGEAKEEAVDEIRGLLDESYDRALENYEEYLTNLEKKIEELREQLGKRKSAKSKIVDLRLKVITNEADGLGWPDNRSSSLFGSSFGLPGAGYFPGQSPFGQSGPAAVASPERPKTPRSTRSSR